MHAKRQNALLDLKIHIVQSRTLLDLFLLLPVAANLVDAAQPFSLDGEGFHGARIYRIEKRRGRQD